MPCWTLRGHQTTERSDPSSTRCRDERSTRRGSHRHGDCKSFAGSRGGVELTNVHGFCLPVKWTTPVYHHQSENRARVTPGRITHASTLVRARGRLFYDVCAVGAHVRRVCTELCNAELLPGAPWFGWYAAEWMLSCVLESTIMGRDNSYEGGNRDDKLLVGLSCDITGRQCRTYESAIATELGNTI